MILSILTPAIPARIAQITALCAELQRQIGAASVEHLVLIDNRKRSVGFKRDALLRAARGRYVAFVDDDDAVSDNYIFELLKATQSNPDVITFKQHCIVNGQVGQVEFRLGNPNEPFQPGGVTRRNAWHVCAWRRSIAIQSGFPDSNYGEDWAFAAPLCGIPGLREVHVDLALHSYHHDLKTTAAPPPVG